MKKLYQIAEFKSFIEEGKEAEGCIPLPRATFKQLEDFLIGYKQKAKDKDIPDIYSLGNRKTVGRVLTVQNYVGVITLPNGDYIEILPKTCLNVNDEDEVAQNRKLVLTMLKTLRTNDFKCLNLASIDCKKMTILDVFITRFLEEVTKIVKRGLKSSYLSVEENCNFFKGKMLFAQQLKHNLLHKERNYVQYDQFSVNRAENKLIKASLQYLYRCTNSTTIQQLLGYFEGVEESTNYAKDFAACVGGRGMETYVLTLDWCKIFLEQKSITPWAGKQQTPSVLFSMQELFEAYVGKLMQEMADSDKYDVSLQDKKYHLVEKPQNSFEIRPDIVIRGKDKVEGQKTWVMDTKWKILDKTKKNYGIKQSDMYQMYAYMCKYEAGNVTLIYPATKNEVQEVTYSASDVRIHVKFVKLFKAEEDVRRILDLAIADHRENNI